MSSIYQNILGLVLLYKYTVLFFVAFLSSLGVPLPAGSSTVASAAFASQGYLNIFLVMLVGAMGNILGDLCMYFIFRFYGKKILNWLRLRKLAESKLLKDLETVENNYSAVAIISSRFQDQSTALVNIIAGLGKMKLRRFITYAIIGDILQIVFFSSIGYFFAESWPAFYNVIGILGWLIVLSTIVTLVLAVNKFRKMLK